MADVPPYFSEVAPFPSDVPIAGLPTISYQKLENGDQHEALRLLNACRYYGFFLLDLKQCTDGQAVLDAADGLYDLAKSTMSLDRDALDEYAYNPKVSLIGYKRAGLLKTDDGGLDTTDLYTVGQDGILGNEPRRQNPGPVEARRDDCREYFLHARRVVTVVLDSLNNQLGPPPQSRRITLGAHTDIGIITLPFHGAGGLQILPPNEESIDANWRYIKPVPGCAVINIGDTLVEWTGGLLRSSLIRVITARGDQSSVKRHSFGFFVRPAREETMKRLRSETGMIPAPGGEDKEDGRLVDVWAAERAAQIIRGDLKPHSFGGSNVAIAMT